MPLADLCADGVEGAADVAPLSKAAAGLIEFTIPRCNACPRRADRSRRPEARIIGITCHSIEEDVVFARGALYAAL
jgi:hypothetical protein